MWQGPGETYLLPLPSSHEGRLGTLVVDIRPEVGHVGFGRSLCLLDSFFDLGLGLFVDSLELLFGGETPVFDVFLETTDRVLGAAHFLYLVASTVGGTGIGHALNHIIRAPIGDSDRGVRHARVTAVTVGDVFHKEGTFAVGNPLFRKLDALVDGDDIHGIYLTRLVSSHTSQSVGDRSYLDTGDRITASVIGGVC